MKRLLIVAVLFTACHVPNDRAWEVDWRGYQPLQGHARALEILEAHAPCAPPWGWGGEISYWPLPFQCGDPRYDMWVSGCMPNGITVGVFAIGYTSPVSATALPDEIGHFMWNECGWGVGESISGAYTQGFIAWLDAVRADMRAEGL